MAAKQYSSYAEIDRDLAILKLERQLHLEKVKYELDNAKENLKFGNLVEGYFGFSFENKSSVIFKVIRFITPYVLKFMKSKKKDE